ncbi:MAG: hypothetical protein KDK99_04785 [Verrucomicrobiales bacterium]|nr:hypothetical protein [Verrucomicrobiales bacterium]
MRIKLFKLAARVRVLKTRVEVHVARQHPASQRQAQVVAQALRVSSAPAASG